jgi:hypothetical protein
MSTSTNLLLSLQADLNQARANIPLAHYKVPVGVISSPDSAFVYINDWAFLNGHAYVELSGSAKEGRYRYSCIFHLRKEGERTRNTRNIKEKDRKRVNLYIRGIECPVKITVSRYVQRIAFKITLILSRIKTQGDQWVLRHTNFDQHNHLLLRIPSPFNPIYRVDQALQRLFQWQKHTVGFLYT